MSRTTDTATPTEPASGRPHAQPECGSCLEPVPTPCVLPCLHSVCERCAEDVRAAERPACPLCREACGPRGVVAARPQPDPCAVSPEESLKLMSLLSAALSLAEQAAWLLQDARDMRAFVAENERRLLRDIDEAYGRLCCGASGADGTAAHKEEARRARAYGLRRDALVAEALALAAADAKAADLAVDAAEALVQHAELCAAHAKVVGFPRDVLRARVNSLLRRRSTLPALASAPYLMAVRPLRCDTEPHACIGRTLLFHERWAEPSYQPPAERHRTDFVAQAALPDGRFVVQDARRQTHYNAPAKANGVLETVAFVGRADGGLLLHNDATSYAGSFLGVQSDGAGRVWAYCESGHILRWAADGALRRWNINAPLERLALNMNMLVERQIKALVVAPCGLVIFATSFAEIYAVTPDLCLVWRRCQVAAKQRPDVWFLAVVHSDALYVPQGAAADRWLSVHTGDDIPAGLYCVRPVRYPWSGQGHADGRALALQRVWLPPRLARDLMPREIAPAAPPEASRVWQTRDFVLRADPYVLAAHGRIFMNTKLGETQIL